MHAGPFRDLWVGTTLGQFGQQFATVAVLQQTWELTGSPVWTGAIGIATAVPMIVFGLLGGSLADMADRRTIVRATTTLQFLAALALIVQAAVGNVSVVLLLGLVALQTVAAALGAPARRTLPVRLLPADQVAAGLALSNVSFQAAMLVGPAVAGVVLAAWQFPAAYAFHALAIAASLVAVVRLPPIPPDRTLHDASMAPTRWRPSAGGWAFILRRPTLWGSFAVDLASCGLAMPVALFPLINELRFGGDPRTLGFFLSSIAVGGITAGLFSGWITRLRRSGAVQLTAAGIWGLALAGFGLAGPVWAALGCLAIAGAADSISVFTRGALIQLETPDGYRGRVSSVEQVIGAAGPEIGNFRGGLVASLTSAPLSLVTGGLAATAATLVISAINEPLRRYTIPTRGACR
nr:MFS transporter [Pseudonocardia sp. C8]